MTDAKLEVDIHAHWNDEPPVYRIFVDEELFTERTFGWQSFRTFIREHIYCNLDNGLHSVKLEHLGRDCRFDLVNLKLNNHLIDAKFLDIQPDKIVWNFIVSN
jgi:hypothetical protein